MWREKKTISIPKPYGGYQEGELGGGIGKGKRGKRENRPGGSIRVGVADAAIK